MKQLLNRDECTAMRGVAILGIVLHNYCHWLGMAVKENEYTFRAKNVEGMLQAVANADWNLPIHLLSFFGHYGVPVFLFLSAYGLVMKYEQSLPTPAPAALGGNATTAKEESVWQFIKKHFLKLFDMMIWGFVAFTMIDMITPGAHHYHLMDVVAQMGMFNNLMPDPDHIIWPGPYWFFGLMLQLYIVYRLILYPGKGSLAGLFGADSRKASLWLGILLVAVCWALQASCAPESEALNRLRYNCIGGILPFFLGLQAARMNWNVLEGTLSRQRVIFATALCVTLVFIAGWSLEYEAWFWVPAAVCVFAVALVKMTPKSINKAMIWVGGISSAMFVLHPITRKIFIPISRHGDFYTGLLLYIIATFVVALAYQRAKSSKR